MSFSRLGASAPGAATETDLYTVPANTETVVGTIAICNRGTSGTVRVGIGPNGAGSMANADWIVYDLTIAAGESQFLHGFTLEAGDIITVYASSANFSFQAHGQEIAV